MGVSVKHSLMGLGAGTDCRTEDTDLEKWSPGGGGGVGGAGLPYGS